MQFFNNRARIYAHVVFTLLLFATVPVTTLGQDDEGNKEQVLADSSVVDEEIRLTKGIILYEQSDYAEALALFQGFPESNTVAAHYAELCDANIGEDQVEQVGFDSRPCDRLGCDTVACDTIASDCIANRRAARPWHLTFLTGYQYDSNVTLEPEFVGLGSGQGIEDSSWLIAAFGDYQLVQRERWNVGAIGSVYANQHFEANEFDAHDFMGGAYTNYLVNGWLMAGVRYEYHETLLDYGSFVSQHRLVPNATMLQGEFGHLTAYYEFDGQDFDFTPLVPAQDRSGETNSFGFTQAVYTFGGDGRIYGGYRYDRASTDGTDFDRKTNMVTGRVEIPLCRRAIIDGEYRHFWDDYDNPNSLDFAGRPREDRRSEVRTGLQVTCNQHISLRADYTYIDSNSNTANLFDVRFFDYDRHIFSSQLIYDF